MLLQRELLPCRVSLADGESLDGFLERLACANGLLPSQLLRLLAALPVWCEVAQGSLDGSPTMVGPPRRAAKAAYRAFRGRLPVSAQDALRSLVLSGSLA
jgi:hypothetical protein